MVLHINADTCYYSVHWPGLSLLPLCGQGLGERARAVLTGEVEDVPCGLIISSIGYKSLPIDPSVPFDSHKAIVPNSVGRVQQAAGTHETPFKKKTSQRATTLSWNSESMFMFLSRFVLQRLAENRPNWGDSHHYEQQLWHRTLRDGGHGLGNAGCICCQAGFTKHHWPSRKKRYSAVPLCVSPLLLSPVL